MFGLVPLSDAQVCAAGGIHYKFASRFEEPA